MLYFQSIISIYITTWWDESSFHPTEAQKSDGAGEEDNKLQSFVETQLFWAHDLSTTPGSS